VDGAHGGGGGGATGEEGKNGLTLKICGMKNNGKSIGFGASGKQRMWTQRKGRSCILKDQPTRRLLHRTDAFQ